nr:tyrosine-type recombinase/integrase [Azospirillum sp. INR13]
MFRWLELDEVIEISPFHRLDARIRLPRRLPRNLTDDEVRRLRAAALAGAGITGRITETKAVRAARKADHDAFTALVAVEVLLATGLRVGELAGMRVEDVDLTGRVITIVGKGSRQRRVFLPDDAVTALVTAYQGVTGARRRDHDRFLMTGTGGPASTQHLRLLIRGIGEDAQLSRRVTPHMLRHTAATRLLENGVDIRFVQRLLGHQSISTTEIYTTVTDASLRAAVVKAAEGMRGGR